MDKKLDKFIKKSKNLFKYIAVDEDGEVYVYGKKPEVNKDYGNWSSRSEPFFNIGTTNDEELKNNWKKTLRKIR